MYKVLFYITLLFIGLGNCVSIHLQKLNNCSQQSRVAINCPGIPQATCCKSRINFKRAVYFRGTISGDVVINWKSNSPFITAPSRYCNIAHETDVGGPNKCLKGPRTSGGGSWHPLCNLSGCAKRDMSSNQTDIENLRCESDIDGDMLAYPPEGGVLVIPGSEVGNVYHAFEGVDPDNDEEMIKIFKKVGAKYYPKVSDYSDEINEDGSSKQ